MKNKPIFLGIFGIISILLLLGCKNEPTTKEPMLGQVVFLKQIQVKTQKNGTINKWLLTQNEFVQKDQIVAILANNATLKKKKEELKKAEKRFTDNKALLIKECNKTQTQYIKIKNQYQDLAELKDAIAAKETLKIKKELTTLESEKNDYQAKLAKYDKASSEAMELENLKKQMNRLKQSPVSLNVNAPISGLVLKILVPTWSYVQVNQPIAEIGTTTDLRVKIFSPKSNKLKIGQTVQLSFRSIQVLGRIEQIDLPIQFKNQQQYKPMYIKIVASPTDLKKLIVESICWIKTK